MADLNECPYPGCGRKAEDNASSDWFPVYTCLEPDCGTKYCSEQGPPCPDCKSSNYGEFDKVYAETESS